MENIAPSPLLSHSTDGALIPSMRHTLLNRWIDHDADTIAHIIDMEKTAQGNLASIARLSAKDLSSLCSVALGTPQSATVLSF